MYKYYFILLKLLKFNYRNLKSIVNLSILISTFICVTLIPISLSVINGFEENIVSKIISFDGYSRVYLDEIDIKHYNPLDDTSFLTPFYESQGLVKTADGSEAVTIFSYLDLYNPIYNIIYISKENNEGVFIGKSLYDKLFLSIPDDSVEKKIILVDSDNTIENVEVLGIFQTHIPLYDEHFVLSNMKEYPVTGFIADKNIYDTLNSNIKDFFYTYNERYYDFLKWLNSYDMPIFILLLSIIFIVIVNNIFCFNIDLTNRNIDSYILNLLGLSSKQIYLIYFYKYILISFLGILLGTFTSIILIYMQLNYDLIKIPKEIYFASSIPLSIKMKYFLYVPLIILFQSVYFLIVGRRSSNVL